MPLVELEGDDFTDEMRHCFFRTFSFTDLHRLLPRITLTLPPASAAGAAAPAPGPETVALAGGASRQRLYQLIDAVAFCVEEPAVYRRMTSTVEKALFGVQRGPDSVASTSSEADANLNVPDGATMAAGGVVSPALNQRVTEAAIRAVGLGSATARVLNLVHQSIVIRGLARIHSCFDPQTLQGMRDVREPHGWRINIGLDPAAGVSVAHTRRESCGNPAAGERGSFEIEWTVCLELDAMVSDIADVRLTLDSLECSAAMPTETAAKIAHDLCDGRVVLGTALAGRSRPGAPRIGLPTGFRHLQHVGHGTSWRELQDDPHGGGDECTRVRSMCEI